MDYQLENQEGTFSEWKRVTRPNKVLAKIVFGTEEELNLRRKQVYNEAAATCNILDFQCHQKANPPSITLHLENHHDLIKIKAKLKDFTVTEILKNDLESDNKLLLICNSPKTTINDIKLRMKEFGTIIYVSHYNVTNSSKKFFTVTYEDKASCEQLIQKRMLFLGRDLIFIQKLDPNTHLPRRKGLIMKLSNLPLATTDWDLQEIMHDLKAVTWKVPFSKNLKRIPMCYVSFNNEDDFFVAKRTKLKLKGQELMWSSAEEKVCERCLSTDHEFLQCKTYYKLAARNPRPLGIITPANASFVTPNLSYSDVSAPSAALLEKQREELKALKEINDSLEFEINRAMRLKNLQKQLESQKETDPETENMELANVSAQNRLDALEGKLAAIDQLIRNINTVRPETVSSALEDAAKKFDQRLLSVEESINNLLEILGTQKNKCESDVKRPKRALRSPRK